MTKSSNGVLGQPPIKLRLAIFIHIAMFIQAHLMAIQTVQEALCLNALKKVQTICFMKKVLLFKQGYKVMGDAE